MNANALHWSFVFMPNAAYGTAHIGHMWAACHGRFLHDYAKSCSKQDGFDTNFAWLLCFDRASKPDKEAAYIDMLGWLDCPPSAIHHLRDIPVSSADGFINKACYLRRDLNPSSRHLWEMLRLLYFRTHNVYWHGRGTDLYYAVAEKCEAEIQAFCPPLQRPVIFYFPILRDEAGQKLDCERLDPTYAVDAELMAVKPQAVFQAIVRSFGGIPQDVYRAKIDELKKGPPPNAASCVQQFYRAPDAVVTPENHAVLWEQLRVPRDWRKHIE